MEGSLKAGKWAKRIMDVCVSLAFLVVFGLPLACIAVAIKLESRGPSIFKQRRVGLNGEQFILYKFRSMRQVGEDEELHRQEERVTAFGRFIRKWRLDESPQFFNVLKGEMSLVGPRPALPYQAERYDKEQGKRLRVKPGVTGWAQIHGDEAISWPDRIALDNWYIDHWSLWLDIKILLRTPLSLMKISRVNVASPPPTDTISELEEE